MKQSDHKVLFASSEVFPFAKTGGLADISYMLPIQLASLGIDIRIIMPGYKNTLKKLRKENFLIDSHTEIQMSSGETVSLIMSTLPHSDIKIWLVSSHIFDREGSPYFDDQSNDWPDNAQRFSLFCEVVTLVSLGIPSLNWEPDIVHCNDWHTGLIPALLSTYEHRPATLFTVHNLAFQGIFPKSTFEELNLPPSLWNFDGVEFYGQLSFIKGGLMFADWINTVSPQYAQEIKTKDFGEGLDSIFRYRRKCFSGILNGIDTKEWNPNTDKHILANYNQNYKTLKLKSCNKRALQNTFSLEEDHRKILFSWVGRLCSQKGMKLMITALKELLPHKKSRANFQWVLLGSGDKQYETELLRIAQEYPLQVGVKIGYCESLAHEIISSADFFLMPSMYEPCGLTQMYSQRYGTPPIASRVGGLVDTIVDNPDNQRLKENSAENINKQRRSGILFDQSTTTNFINAIKAAEKVYRHPRHYKALQVAGMTRDFSWQDSAKAYSKLYREIIAVIVQ